MEINRVIIDHIEFNSIVIRDFIESRKSAMSKLKAQSNGWSTIKLDASSAEPEPELAKILDHARKCLAAITGKDRAVVYWFVCLEHGGHIDIHDHHQADASAVVYLETAEKYTGGRLLFDSGIEIKPRAGRAVYFSGLHKHAVSTYYGHGPRYSIAINRI